MAVQEHKETPLQMCISSYLRGEIVDGNKIRHVLAPFPELVWSYTGGEGKDDTDRFWLGRKGRLSGIYDYVSWYYGLPPQAIETKVDDKGLSPKQITFKRRFEATGGITYIARTVWQVRDFYIGLGIPCKNMICIEPKATFKERQQGYFNMLKPIREDL